MMHVWEGEWRRFVRESLRLLEGVGGSFPCRYAFRFPGSDASVVRSTQRQLILHGTPSDTLPRYAAYFTVPSTFYVGLVALVGGIFQSLANHSWGRNLLLK